tara:strand:+ start:508 stop:936 length:429 start_codon:yes stop_codon:yes gene_type:complete
MSHITRAKCGLKNVNAECLKQSVLAMARMLNGTVEYNVCPKDWHGKQEGSAWGFQKCAMLLKWGEFQDGLGIDIVDGELAFTVDWWGSGGKGSRFEETVKKVMKQIPQAYITVATRRAMQKMGMNVQTSAGAQQQFVVTGVR